VHRRTTIVEEKEEAADQRKSRLTISRKRNALAKKKYKVDLTEHTIRPYSFMLLTIRMQKEGDFVADISFLSSSDSDFMKDENTKIIDESELADIIGRYPFTKFRIRGKSIISMEVSINKDQAIQQYYSDFVADISFLSSSDSDSDSDFTKNENIESINESELADLINKYRIFVEYIKNVEQQKLSTRNKNASRRINLRSFFQQITKGMNATNMKKAMIANGVYIKKATVSTVNAKKVASYLISEFNEVENNSTNREIHTKMNLDGTVVTTTSTIELDADIVTIIQKEPEIRNTTVRNFILNIHMSNVSLSTFFLLNKVNQIFSGLGMIIGFGRMAATPVSMYNSYLLTFSVDPFSILSAALPTGLSVLLPRIARLAIRYRIRKILYYPKLGKAVS
jgi:hypothetical protein